MRSTRTLLPPDLHVLPLRMSSSAHGLCLGWCNLSTMLVLYCAASHCCSTTPLAHVALLLNRHTTDASGGGLTASCTMSMETRVSALTGGVRHCGGCGGQVDLPHHSPSLQTIGGLRKGMRDVWGEKKTIGLHVLQVHGCHRPLPPLVWAHAF